jgi:hypothetical protein
VHGEDGGKVYVGFSGVQAALSAAGAAVAGGGADVFAPVGLGGDAAGRMFAPLLAAEPDSSAAGEPVAVQALALQCFLKLCGNPDFQVSDYYSNEKNICLVIICFMLSALIGAVCLAH